MSVALLNNAACTAVEKNCAPTGKLVDLDPTSIESKLEKLNLKLLQNKLFQSNRHYFMRTSAHFYSSSRPSSSSSSSLSSAASNTTSSASLQSRTNNSLATTGSSSICSASSSSSSGGNTNGKKAKKVVRFADTLGLDLVTIWCVNNQTACLNPKKVRRLASLEDSEDSSEGSSLDDEDLLSSNDEDEYNCNSCWVNQYRNERFQHSTGTQTTLSNECSQSDCTSSNLVTSNTTSTVATSSSSDCSTEEELDCGLPESSSSSSSSSAVAAAAATATTADTFVYDNLMFTWHCRFEQPGISPDFYARLNANKVLLESIYSTNMRLNGVVRVLNLAYAKRVFIRYTIDNWRSYADLDCHHLSCNNAEQDKLTDRFVFSVCLDKSQVLSCIDNTSKLNRAPTLKLEFAVCFVPGGGHAQSSGGTAYWDNNRGENYQYDCTFKIASTSRSSPPSPTSPPPLPLSSSLPSQSIVR